MVFYDQLHSRIVMMSRSIHVVPARISASFFLLSITVPLQWIYHISFIYLSADGHLDSFYFLAMLNNAPVNISIWVFMWTCFPLFGYACLGVELLHHKQTLSLTCRRPAKPSSQVAAPAKCERYNFSTSLPTLANIWSFAFSYSLFFFRCNLHAIKFTFMKCATSWF